MLRGTQADFPPTQVFFASQEKDRGEKTGLFPKNYLKHSFPTGLNKLQKCFSRDFISILHLFVLNFGFRKRSSVLRKW